MLAAVLFVGAVASFAQTGTMSSGSAPGQATPGAQDITSLYDHDSAKFPPGRALGVAEESVKEYFKGK